MNNLFPPHRDVHETYDLKGSTVGRLYSEEKAARNPRAVLKDLNWIDRHKQLELGPEKQAFLKEQLRSDLEFLKKVNVMDYSLLVGIHNMQRGNRDNLRSNTLKVFSVSPPRQSYDWYSELGCLSSLLARHAPHAAQNFPE
jgi:1-phosphatidylinositol-4-phosphate 5-kinase